MRISDWSSDVCSSDLQGVNGDLGQQQGQQNSAAGGNLRQNYGPDDSYSLGEIAAGELSGHAAGKDGRQGKRRPLLRYTLGDEQKGDECQESVDRKSTRLNSSH